MTLRNPDGHQACVQLRMLKRRLTAMFPVEDSGSFASLLAALDNLRSQPASKGPLER